MTDEARAEKRQDARPSWSSDLVSGTDEIVEAWLSQLPGASTGGRGFAALSRSYGDLVRLVLRLGLASEPGSDPGDLVRRLNESPDMARALAAVTADSRKAGQSISTTLDDFARLTPAIFAWLRKRLDSPDHPDTANDILLATESAVLALNVVTRHLTRLLEASAARAARERSEALAAMADMMSHELANRLGAARTASQMLLSPEIEVGQDMLERAAELVRSSVDEGLRTVEDVRTLTASAGRVEGESVRTVELDVLVRRIIQEFEPSALDAGIVLEVDDDLPSCRVDASRLRLVLFNLVGNGIKYRDRNEERPFVRIAARVEDEDQDGRVVVEVRDNGIGIAPDEIDHVFTYRARGNQGDDVPGSGLGLAIAQEAMEQIGGDIRVESEPGDGTTFRLRFPRSDPGAAAD